MSAYYDFIEEQRNTVQLGELEEHHIKSRKNYPDLSEERTNILSLSVESIPEGEGWQKGRGPNVWNKGKPSYKRRRVKCTITGHEGTQQSLARWQKNRGIDPSNREFID